MSKTDFQNGFALGLTSGGVVSIDEQTIEQYAEKNLKYNRIYRIDTTFLKDIIVDDNKPVFELNVYKGRSVNGFYVDFIFSLFTHYKQGENILPYMENPLVVVGEGEFLSYENIGNIYNAGISLNYENEIVGFSFDELIYNLTDSDAGTTAQKSFTTGHFGTGDNLKIYLQSEFTLYANDENVCDTFAGELESMFAMGEYFDIYYENKPEPIIESEIYV